MSTDLIADRDQLSINRDFAERPGRLLAKHGQMRELQLAERENGKTPQQIPRRQQFPRRRFFLMTLFLFLSFGSRLNRLYGQHMNGHLFEQDTIRTSLKQLSQVIVNLCIRQGDHEPFFSQILLE